MICYGNETQRNAVARDGYESTALREKKITIADRAQLGGDSMFHINTSFQILYTLRAGERTAPADTGKERRMFDLSLLTDPRTGEEYLNVPTSIAAQFLGINRHKLCEGIESGRLPIGSAWKKDQWTYIIPCERLKAFALGYDVSVLAQLVGVKT